MKNVLITGATGNIGFEVIKYLSLKNDINIYAGLRNEQKSKQEFVEFPDLNFRYFDFDNPETFNNALLNIDTVFLLRPPHISDIDKYFNPLFKVIKLLNIKEIVFLSVQGAEKSKIIPHNKIETLILKTDIEYIFIRPSYFMQNLTTTLLNDIRLKRKILLPAGNAKFNWIDVKNIGEITAYMIQNFNNFKNNAYEITGYENEDFYKVEEYINIVANPKIKYHSLNPFVFFFLKRKEKFSIGFIIVMLMLHFLPRFQKEPTINRFYEEITGKKPTKLEDFINQNAGLFN